MYLRGSVLSDFPRFLPTWKPVTRVAKRAEQTKENEKVGVGGKHAFN